MPGLIDFILHIDTHLIDLIDKFGSFSYVLLFLVIFAETGLVVTPFLPGDSLLFAVGAISAKGGFEIFTVYFLLLAAAILGDNTNYFIGRKIGRKAFRGKHIFSEEHLVKTEKFYEDHGPKTVLLARFLPILRTFAPFVAGIGKMDFWKFFSYSVTGVFLWITLFLMGGYFFGNIPFVKDNFTYVILVIIGFSLIPGVWAYMVEYSKRKRKAKVNES